jgi:hypothetical protein
MATFFQYEEVNSSSIHQQMCCEVEVKMGCVDTLYIYICMYVCMYVLYTDNYIIYIYVYVLYNLYTVGGAGSPIGRQSGSLNLRKNNVLLW